MAFVGACAVVDETGWLSDDGDVWYSVGSPPLLPPHWSPDGTNLILDWWSGSYLVDVTSNATTLTEINLQGRRERVFPHITPDGLRMVFSTEVDWFDRGDSDIWLADLDGSNLRRMTRSRGNQFSQRWSSDGTHIAFISCLRVRRDAVERTCSLYSMAATGSGHRKLVDSVQATGGIAWSPDGRTIAFLGNGLDQLEKWPNDQYIYIVDHDGLNLIRLAESSSPPAWSPDGSRIAFLRGDDRYELFVINQDGSGLRKIAALDFLERWAWPPIPSLSWSPDGSEILLQDYPFILVRADGTEKPDRIAPYAVFAGPEDWEKVISSWSPDGSRIAITVQQSAGNDPGDGDAFLLTMKRNGSDMRVVVRIGKSGPYAVPNEPWEGEGGWVWHYP